VSLRPQPDRLSRVYPPQRQGRPNPGHGQNSSWVIERALDDSTQDGLPDLAAMPALASMERTSSDS
jgi:hypothetical protein